MKKINSKVKFLLSFVLVLSQIFTPVLAQDLSNQVNVKQEGIGSLGLEHKIESLSDDCKREIKGSITFEAPEPSSKPLDLVIVQDRSASFKSTFKSMKNDLERIIDDFTTEEDRVMITSYAGGNQYEFYDKKDSSFEVSLEEFKRLEDNSEYINGNFERKKSEKRGVPDVTINHSELSPDKDIAKGFIEEMEILEKGNTPSALGLKEALEKYDEYNSLNKDIEDRETIFLFITDGIANVDLQEKRHLVYKEVEDSDGTMKASTYVNADIIKPHVSDMVKMGEKIKESGYYLATSFILQDRDEERINSEDPRFKNYDKHFAYSEKAFKFMASGENYYIKARELEDNEFESGKDSEFYVGIEEMLSTLIEDINKKTLELDISDNYDIDSFDIENIKGLEIEDKNEILKVDKDSKKIIIDIRDLTPGKKYTINYKLNELELNTDGDKNFLPGFIKVGKIDSNGKLLEEKYKFEGIELEKNDKDLCKIDISKKVNDKEEDLIDEENNEIIYETEVKVKSSDDLKKLEIIEEYDDKFLEEIKEDNIKVYYKDENGNKNPLEVDIVIEKGKVISKIKEEDLPKLKDKTIILESKTKIKEGKTDEDILKKYEDGKIPSDSKIKYKYGEENTEDIEKSSNEVNIITKNEDEDTDGDDSEQDKDKDEDDNQDKPGEDVEDEKEDEKETEKEDEKETEKEDEKENEKENEKEDEKEDEKENEKEDEKEDEKENEKEDEKEDEDKPGIIVPEKPEEEKPEEEKPEEEKPEEEKPEEEKPEEEKPEEEKPEEEKPEEEKPEEEKPEEEKPEEEKPEEEKPEEEKPEEEKPVEDRPEEEKKEVTIVDKNNKPVKPGQNYVIKDNNGKVVEEGIVDKDGKIVIENLPAGRYKVEGLEDDYLLVVTEDGDYIVSIVEHKNPDSVGNVSDDQDYTGDVDEEAGETSVGGVLPRTGQGTNLLVLFLGIILVSLGFYSLKKSY